jgi:ABC-2 type transport system permease protein
LSIKNNLNGIEKKSRHKIILMALVGLLFWGLMFYLALRILIYFKSVEVIGDLLSHRLLSMILLTFFSLLIFSNIITSLSNYYLSKDLELCHSLPLELEELFLSRFIYTIIDSSWMLIIFSLPFLLAYGYVYQAELGYYFSLIHLGLALILISAGIGILLTTLLVSVFPAQRTKDVVMIFILFGIIILYFMFRFLRPERMVDPDAFLSMMQYLNALQAPDSPFLPSHWITEKLWMHLIKSGENPIFESLLAWSTAMALLVINLWVARALYFTGFSKSQESKRRRAARNLLDFFLKIIKRPFKAEFAAIIEKDIRIFFRDHSQWSQLLLLSALVVVYLYDFSVLPLERSPIRLDFLQNIFAFLNMGLAGFVLAAVSVRFIFPSVSAEGSAFWIVRSSPVSLKRFLWTKFGIYLLPMVILTEALIILTNYLLKVSLFMMILSSITMVLVVLGIMALAIGLGAVYPNFKY